MPIVVGNPATLDELIGRHQVHRLRPAPRRSLPRAPQGPGERRGCRARSRSSNPSRSGAESIDSPPTSRSNSASPRSPRRPEWVPLRLDGQVLTSAREGTRVLPLRVGASGGWEAEVRGAGEHLLRLAFATRVVALGEDRRLDIPLPVAAANTLSLTLAGDPSRRPSGPASPVRIEKGPGRDSRPDRRRPPPPQPVRIAAGASRRSRSGVLAPLLAASGEIAVDVTADAIRTRSRWSLTSARGRRRFAHLLDRRRRRTSSRSTSTAVPSRSASATSEPPDRLHPACPTRSDPGGTTARRDARDPSPIQLGSPPRGLIRAAARRSTRRS